MTEEERRVERNKFLCPCAWLSSNHVPGLDLLTRRWYAFIPVRQDKHPMLLTSLIGAKQSSVHACSHPDICMLVGTTDQSEKCRAVEAFSIHEHVCWYRTGSVLQEIKTLYHIV